MNMDERPLSDERFSARRLDDDLDDDEDEQDEGA
jgi:hypothetical protein